ncbi:MAG: hypothetical protein LBU98_00360, partial [Alistipes sp.]|nr:hypothetical protein [Alistipes sp.]
MKKLMTSALTGALAAMTAATFTACGDKGGDPEPPAPVITIGTQPAAPAALTEGAITGTLTVAATATGGAALTYQWYSNTSAANTGGTAIDGATAASYALPATLTAGTYHYFCEVGATGAKAVRTNAVTVTVAEAEEPVDNARLIGKWDAAANTLGIVSVEFGVSGNYIVMADRELATRAEEEDLWVYVGPYTIDGGRVTLSGLGTITVKSLDGDAISFTLDTGGGGVEIGAAKAQEMPASDKTDMLCRTWKVVDYETSDPDDDDEDDT